MNSNEILSYVDSMINEEEGKSKKLQSQLSALMSSKGSGISFRAEVRFNIGISRYEHRISSECSFAELKKQVAQREADDLQFGYEDKRKYRIWLRNDSDVRFCFREHFSTNNGSINFTHFKGNEVSKLTSLDLSPVDSFDETGDFVVCKLALIKNDYAVFYRISKERTRTQIMDDLRRIFPDANNLQMIDNDNDVITIQSDTDWNYFINECEFSYSKGAFPVLLIE